MKCQGIVVIHISAVPSFAFQN